MIYEVGFRGDFLSHEHTLRHYREELSLSDLASRTRRQTWVEAGGKTLEERAEEKRKQLLDIEKECVSEDQRDELRKIGRKWLEQLGG